MTRGYKFYSVEEPPPRSPHFIGVVYTTGGVIHGYRCLAKCPCPSTTIQDLYVTLSHSDETSNTLTHLMSPYYTERQPNHNNLMYTVDHTFRYRTKKFICACAKSSAHVHGTEFRGGNIKHLKTSVECAM